MIKKQVFRLKAGDKCPLCNGILLPYHDNRIRYVGFAQAGDLCCLEWRGLKHIFRKVPLQSQSKGESIMELREKR